MTLLYLVVGGATGTVCRHYVSIWVADATNSRTGGTFAVNIAGSFLIGLLMVLATERFSWPSGLVMLAGVGFLGGFTTFSTLAWQAIEQLEAGDYGAAVLYVGASVVCGLFAAWAGASAARFAV